MQDACRMQMWYQNTIGGGFFTRVNVYQLQIKPPNCFPMMTPSHLHDHHTMTNSPESKNLLKSTTAISEITHTKLVMLYQLTKHKWFTVSTLHVRVQMLGAWCGPPFTYISITIKFAHTANFFLPIEPLLLGSCTTASQLTVSCTTSLDATQVPLEYTCSYDSGPEEPCTL